MLTKEKQFSNSDDPRIRAGNEAEKEIAFHLQRRFGKDTTAHIINDLRIEYDGNTFQIDHLVVTPWALFIVESKSVHCPVTIKVWDENREHWSRNFDGKNEGFDSPILQAEEQGRLLKDYLRANSEQMLGKMIGLVQKGFFYCPIISLVAISRTGIINVESGTLRKNVLKADEIAPEIAKQIKELKKKASIFNISLDTGWSMTEEEAAQVASFLSSNHRPRTVSKPTIKTAPKNTDTTSDIKSGSVPRVGATCPTCKTQKLIRKSVKRTDGTETDFLACAGHPKECNQIFALVTKTLGTQEAEAIPVKNEIAQTGKKPQHRQPQKNYCCKCKADIPEVVAKYCFNQPKLFGGRAYCRSCQNEIKMTTQ
jgi:hypothetical protein